MKYSPRVKRFTWIVFLVTAVVIVFTLMTGCGPAKNAATSAKATQTATAADAQLQHDGYAALHVPGFGKADLGIKSGVQYRYEAVYVGKDSEIVKTIVDQANKHPEQGVKFASSGNLVVVNATSLGDLKNAAKTLAHSGV